MSTKLVENFRWTLQNLDKAFVELLVNRMTTLTMMQTEITEVLTEINQTSSDITIQTQSILDYLSGTSTLTVTDGATQQLVAVVRFPSIVRRDLYRAAVQWNAKINIIHRYIEAIKAIVGNNTEQFQNLNATELLPGVVFCCCCCCCRRHSPFFV